jgi:choline dehydrogenase-like flavoprotein
MRIAAAERTPTCVIVPNDLQEADAVEDPPRAHGTLPSGIGDGAQDTLAIDRYAHLVGGCRMGTSPEQSVVDSGHRAWGVPNLFIADGSVMPTQGSANPALTIMALASRLAEQLNRKRATHA